MPWNVHDLRRTVATGLRRLGVRLEVTEAVLNHISGSRGGIASGYQQHDWAAEKHTCHAIYDIASLVTSLVTGDYRYFGKTQLGYASDFYDSPSTIVHMDMLDTDKLLSTVARRSKYLDLSSISPHQTDRCAIRENNRGVM
jgi:hypothetical protein